MMRRMYTRLFEADYVDLCVTGKGSKQSVEPWFAIEDVDSKRDEFLMQSAIDGDIDMRQLSGRSSSVSDFYNYMTEKAGFSEKKMTDMIWGTTNAKDYGEEFEGVFNAACLQYVDRLKEIEAASKELDDEYESEDEPESDKYDEIYRSCDFNKDPADFIYKHLGVLSDFYKDEPYYGYTKDMVAEAIKSEENFEELNKVLKEADSKFGVDAAYYSICSYDELSLGLKEKGLISDATVSVDTNSSSKQSSGSKSRNIEGLVDFSGDSESQDGFQFQ